MQGDRGRRYVKDGQITKKEVHGIVEMRIQANQQKDGRVATKSDEINNQN